MPVTTRTYEQRQRARQRKAEKPSTGWYKSKAWQVRRRDCLAEQRYCQRCLPRPVLATVADHEPRHNEDYTAFFQGPLVALCKTCHDGAKQREEHEGFRRDVDSNGHFVDPRHPSNRDSRR